ncbi:MAG: efflux RND transporter permease subunit [Deltaproteobacteria bacterium]|nr:efflux RND transporter permease subunit [Deltaproteobacteria bacterium]MBW2532980.1 efflux RND transporter permease subunit [Deltaproteobacteria bacterium]
MAKNSVAANLMMLVLLIGGAMTLPTLKQEVFPEFELDIINVSLVYPGASPSEVERSVTAAVEEEIRGIDGIKEVTSTSIEGGATVSAELLLGTNADRALSDIKSAVDRITSFPGDLERPIVSILAMRMGVISIIVYGEATEVALRNLAENIRDDLMQDPRISTVELAGVRPFEISVEVPHEQLRSYGMTLEQIAQTIRAASVEIPAGGVKTERGEVLLRTTERRDVGQEFEEIVLLSRADGTEVKVGDVAKVIDGFADTDQQARYNGKRAAMVNVFRIGDETPLTVAAAVKEYIADHQADLPPGIEMTTLNDRSKMYQERVDLLTRNALIGLVLVLLTLGLFLEVRLAFWVTLGIPISFLGALLFLPPTNVSINMISLFAFIVTLGIVVDDAIVVGEAVYKRRKDGLSFVQAAITGLHDVAAPVVFSVLTTVVAFSPLLFVPGIMGKFFKNIPIVVITVLLLSLIESLLILPAHLAHGKEQGGRGFFGFVHHHQQRFSRAVERFIHRRFVPALTAVVRRRYLALAVGLALLMSSCGFMVGGRIDFTFMPKIEIDTVYAQLAMPYGTPVHISEQNKDKLLQAAKEVLEEEGGLDQISLGIFDQVGAANNAGRARGGGSSGGHLAEVAVYLVPIDQRNINARQFARKWRERIGEIPGADSLKFKFATGAGADDAISIELSHRDVPTLERAAAELAADLGGFTGVKDIDDGVELGKEQLNFKLKPDARSLGISETSLARQVRSAFWGAEATRQQRGRHEIRSYVRLPEAERTSLADLEQLLIRTPQGGEIPLGVAASVDRGRAYTSIKRKDGRRIINVTADVEEGVANANKVVEELRKGALPELMRKYPGLSYDLSGQQQRQEEALTALFRGFAIALIVMFGLMAIPFKSYSQPLIIMSAIPFGIVGALFGHLLMGYDLSLLSGMGFVALSGVVVNDSIVLISAINAFRAQGLSMHEAVIAGAARRFRPILLTSLTTFLGLAPMIFETSVQARFLVPMALSLGYGILFGTLVILLLVPSLYLALEDVRILFRQRREARDSSSRGPDPGGQVVITGRPA